MIVDASVVVPAFAGDSAIGQAARDAMRGHELFAPALLDVEVVSAWRRQVRLGLLDPLDARTAIETLAEAKIDMVPHGLLLLRIWELRENLSAYDAAYVALAESLDMPLLTADKRLGAAPGTRCDIVQIS